MEILNEGDFRSDGRRRFELRSMEIDLSQQGQADGSAVISHGLTQVLVTVFGPREAKLRSQTMHDRANINVEVSVAAFSTGDRRQRSRGDKCGTISLPSSYYLTLKRTTGESWNSLQPSNQLLNQLFRRRYIPVLRLIFLSM